MANKTAYITPSAAETLVRTEQCACTSDYVQGGSIADITEIERTGDWNDD